MVEEFCIFIGERYLILSAWSRSICWLSRLSWNYFWVSMNLSNLVILSSSIFLVICKAYSLWDSMASKFWISSDFYIIMVETCAIRC
jgi:hypothetical protein